MRHFHLPFLLALTLSTAPFATLAPLAHAQRPQTVELFNGNDLDGWEVITLPSATPDTTPSWRYNPSGHLTLTGKPVSYLATKASHSNYRLHVEWRWPADAAKNSNSGILLHIASGPANATPWPTCVQLQLKPTRVGDLLPMAGATFAEPLTSAPGAKNPQRDRLAADGEKPLGEWNACDIVSADGKLEIRINGILQNRVTQLSPAAGRIGLQLEGTPFDVRNIRLTSAK